MTMDLTGCTTHKEVTTKIQNLIRTVSIEQVTNDLSTDFIYCEKAIKALYIAFASGNNALLYGPGGYGKSKLVKAFCTYFGIPLICKVGHSDMQTDELFGLPNMKVLLEESRYEVAFENSVFSMPGILLIEEGLDIHPRTAAALKDILTENGFREGTTKKESLISSVVICGNAEPDELSLDNSTAAFYKERFPISERLCWDEHTEENYMSFLELVLHGDYEDVENRQTILLALSALAAETEIPPSPRIIQNAAKIALELGISAITTVKGIKTSGLEEMLRNKAVETQNSTEYDLLVALKKAIKDEEDLLSEDKTTPTLWTVKTRINLIQKKLDEKQFSEHNMRNVIKIREQLSSVNEVCDDGLNLLINVKAAQENVSELFTHTATS